MTLSVSETVFDTINHDDNDDKNDNDNYNASDNDNDCEHQGGWNSVWHNKPRVRQSGAEESKTKEQGMLIKIDDANNKLYWLFRL